jgi:hypothetical protein
VGVVLVIVALLLLGFLIASFFVRRHGESDRPRPGWQRTDEVFRDPSTGRLMRVWTDPRNGDRHYVPDPGGSAG